MRLGCILIAAGLLAACGQERADAPAATPAPAETKADPGLDSRPPACPVYAAAPFIGPARAPPCGPKREKRALCRA